MNDSAFRIPVSQYLFCINSVAANPGCNITLLHHRLMPELQVIEELYGQRFRYYMRQVVNDQPPAQLGYCQYMVFIESSCARITDISQDTRFLRAIPASS
jgi:hypothetical protein